MTNTPHPPSPLMIPGQPQEQFVHHNIYSRFDIRLRTCVQLSNHLPIPGLRLNYVIHIACKNGSTAEKYLLCYCWWCGGELSGLENLFLMVVRPQGNQCLLCCDRRSYVGDFATFLVLARGHNI